MRVVNSSLPRTIVKYDCLNAHSTSNLNRIIISQHIHNITYFNSTWCKL